MKVTMTIRLDGPPDEMKDFREMFEQAVQRGGFGPKEQIEVDVRWVVQGGKQ